MTIINFYYKIGNIKGENETIGKSRQTIGKSRQTIGKSRQTIGNNNNNITHDCHIFLFQK